MKTPIQKRETKYTALDLDTVAETGELSGYASIFGEVDLGNDVIAKGAFANTLKNRSAASIRMLFQHDPDQPVGVWSLIREDDTGLFVRGKICDETEKGRELIGLLRAGALDGLSIGFRTVRSIKSADSNVRTILEAELWEISIVTFPMQENARIQDFKSTLATRAPFAKGAANMNKSLPTKREFENWLKRDVGLSRSEALAVIAKGYSAVIGKRDAARDPSEHLATIISQATRTLAAPRSAKRRI